MTSKTLDAVFCFIFIITAATSALEPADCLFYAPFDGRIDALVAAGKPDGELANELQYMDGIRGQALVLGNYEGRQCGPVSFDVQDNISGPVGSISFWAKCIGENYFFKASGYYTFFSAHTEEASLTFRDYISATALWVNGQGKRIDTGIWIYWEADAWNHVVITWSPTEYRLYVGGELQAVTTEETVAFTTFKGRFTLGSESKSAIAMDDFAVYNRPLLPAEVKALYNMNRGIAVGDPEKRNLIAADSLQAATESPSVAAITVSATKTPPAVDGLLSDKVWQNAAQVGFFTDELTGTMTGDGPQILLTYDEKNLYFAMRAAIPGVFRESPALFPTGPFLRTAKQRDTQTWRDDHFTVVIQDADNVPCSFSITAGGVLADDKNGDSSWNSNFTAQTRDNDDEWTIEMRLPLQELGFAATPPDRLKINFSQTLRLLQNTRRSWFVGQSGGGLATMQLAGNAPVIQCGSILTAEDGTMSSSFRLVNPLNAELTATVVQTVSRQPPAEEEISVAAFSSHPFTLDHTLEAPLTAHWEIAVRHHESELYRARLPFSFAPLLQVSQRYYPGSEQLTIFINRTALAWQEMTAKISVTPEGKKKKVLTREVEKVAPYIHEVVLETSKLKPGSYAVKVALAGDGRQTEADLEFAKKKKPRWAKSEAGISETPPPPFTPMQAEGSVVSLWGRTYDFSNALFARQYTTQQRELLTRPVTLVMKTGDNAILLADADSRIDSVSPTAVEISAEKVAEAISVRTKTRLEFDGFSWIEMTVTPNGKKTVQELYLEIPMHKELAKLMYTGSYGGQNCGFIPETGFQAGEYINGHWFGWGSGGIQLFREHGHNWQSKSHGRIVHLDDAIAYRLVFIDHEVTLDKPFTVAFGIQATPTRPRPDDWRQWWITYNKRDMGSRGVAFWNTHWSIGVNYPVLAADSNPEFRGKEKLGHLSKEGYIRDAGGTWHTWEDIRRLEREENITSLMYVQGGYTWPCSPEYQYYKEEWRSVPSRRVPVKPGAENDWWAGQAPVCPNSSFTDFYVASLEKSIERENIRGLYFDCWTARHCANPMHNCGYLDDDGKLKTVFPLLAQREFYKRVYTVLKSRDPDSIVAFHMSGQPWMALCSFADLMATGEQYATGLSRRVAAGEPGNYYEILALDHAQAEFMGRNWGPAQAFLTEFGAAEPGESYPNRKNPFGARYYRDERLQEIYHGAGIFALHDMIMPWAFRCNVMPFYRTRRALESIGFDKTVEFVPYWNNDSFVSISLNQGTAEEPNFEPVASDSGVVCSIYRKEGKALFVLMNNTDKEQPQVKLNVNYDVLGFRPTDNNKMTDALSGAMYGYQGEEDAVIVPLQPRSFRIMATYWPY